MYKFTRRLIAVFLVFFLAIISLESSAHADLISPKSGNKEKPKVQTKKLRTELTLDELLGPEDKFPFLPDNHRDSGTGKFAYY